MAYIQQFYTWSTGNTITAARLNGNVTNIVNSLNGSGGDRQVNVGSLEIGGVTVIDSSMNIDTGASNLTVGGKVNIDIDGTTLNANGSLNFGADQDAGILFNGTDLVIATDGAGASGIILDSEDDTLEIKGSGDLQATFDASGLNIVSGDAFSIDGTSVLNATTLGTGVLTSSLTTVGILDSGSITSGFGDIDIGSSNIDGGTITASTALGGTLSTASQPNITGVGTLGSLRVNGYTQLGDSGTSSIDVALKVTDLTKNLQMRIGHTANGLSPIFRLQGKHSAGSHITYSDISLNAEDRELTIWAPSGGEPINKAIQCSITAQVGIGTSPSEKLHVDGNILADGNITTEGGFLGTGSTSNTVTISSGEITSDRSNIRVYGEGGAADDLTIINGGSAGDILFIIVYLPSVAPVTVKNSYPSGNIILTNGDFIMDSQYYILQLRFDSQFGSGAWVEVSRNG